MATHEKGKRWKMVNRKREKLRKVIGIQQFLFPAGASYEMSKIELFFNYYIG